MYRLFRYKSYALNQKVYFKQPWPLKDWNFWKSKIIWIQNAFLSFQKILMKPLLTLKIIVDEIAFKHPFFYLFKFTELPEKP